MRHLNPELDYAETPEIVCNYCDDVGHFVVTMTYRQRLAVMRMLREGVYNDQAFMDIATGTFTAPCPACHTWKPRS